jgi:hypothetical protein
MLRKQKFPGSILRRLNSPFGWHVPGNAIFRLFLLTAGMVVVSGCGASADNAIGASLDENFQLRIGQSAVISAVDMEVGFEAVTSDSRCGKGEQCVWEGDATVRIWTQLAGGNKEENELHTESKMPSAVAFAGYTVRLVALHPIPLSGRVIAPSAYIATFGVVHGTSGGDVVH